MTPAGHFEHARVARTVYAMLIVCLLGCAAAGGDKVKPTVPAKVSLPTISGANRAISVVRPSDARSQTRALGREVYVASDPFTNTHSIQIEYWSPKSDIPAWIGNSFATALERAGFRVDKVSALSASSTPLSLTIEITEVWVDMGPSPRGLFLLGAREARARIVVKTELYSRGERVAKRSYGGSFEDTKTFSFTDEMFRDLIDGALNNMLSKAIPDLAWVISREPK